MTDISLADLADLLPIDRVTWTIRRNDEMSGLGDGRVYAVELAPPIWSAEVTLCDMPNDEAKQIAARIRALNGPLQAFMLYDPLSIYPQADPAGAVIGASVVTVSSIGADRRHINLSGLPAAYTLTAGDKLQIPYMQGATQRHSFLEVSATASAGGTGAITDLAVFPNVPIALAGGETVILSRAACRCVIVPGSHHPGMAGSVITSGQSFQVVQRK